MSPQTACAQTHSPADTRSGTGGGLAVLKVQETYGEKEVLGCLVRAKGTAAIVPSSSPPRGQSADWPHSACSEPSPRMANSEAALAGVIHQPHPTHKLNAAGLLRESQYHTASSWGRTFHSGTKRRFAWHTYLKADI